MQRTGFFFIFLFTISQFYAQSFEGKIFFIKASATDTIQYTYLVKNKNMRVDELDYNGNVLQSLLIDLDEKQMTALSPARKMYMPFPVKPFKMQDSSNFIIKKTKESKPLFNYNCQKWTIKNTKDSVSIDYWIAKDHFDFFIDFLNTSNTADKSAIYYLQFSNNYGCFPMLSVEKDFSGKETLRLEVLKIEPGNLDDILFKIPAGYVSFQR